MVLKYWGPIVIIAGSITGSSLFRGCTRVPCNPGHAKCCRVAAGRVLRKSAMAQDISCLKLIGLDFFPVKITPDAGATWVGMLLIAKRADPSLNQNEAIGTFTTIANTAELSCQAGGVRQTQPATLSLISAQWAREIIFLLILI